MASAEWLTMDERDTERMLPGWQVASEAVAQELVVWREAHPRANLTQIEDAVFEAMQRLQARALEQVVRASATADVAAQPVAERPRCPTCGGLLEPRGRQRRTIRPARQRAALELDRSYAVCAECGAGLFPPG
jgi:RNase P subunit RPR2